MSIPDNFHNLILNHQVGEIDNPTQIEIKEESFKIGMLCSELFQNCSNLFGFDRLGTFLTYCRKGVDWIYKSDSMVKGELLFSLENVIKSPSDLANFSKALRDVAELISAPVEIALKYTSNQSDFTSILSQAHQTYLNKSLNLKALENDLKNLDTSVSDLTLAIPHEKTKINAMKVNSLIDTFGIIAKKTGVYELFTCLALISTLTRLYILYLDKTNLKPEELLKILKTETELTLKLQEKKIQVALLNSEFVQQISPEEQSEILSEIHNMFATHLDLIVTSKNDFIYQELIAYEESLNNLCSAYQLKTKEIQELNLEIDSLIDKTKILVEHKEEIEKQGTKLIDDYKILLKKEKKITKEFLKKFKEKLTDHNFKAFIEPEFKTTLVYLSKQLIETEKDLKKLQLDPKYRISPFSLLSVNEQRNWYTDIKEKYGPKQQQELVNMIKNICRQI
jgi:hypothetical protein